MTRILLLSLIFLLSFKPMDDKMNDASAFANLNLPNYSEKELVKDFDLLVNSLKEGHTGLYWYSTEKEFHKMVAIQRAQLKDSLSGLDFYNIVAPIVAFTKEDHCDIALSEEISQSLTDKGMFLPLSVIHLHNKTYIINNPLTDNSIKGFELVAVNGKSIGWINNQLFNTFASDGFILSSKYRYLDFRGFAREYAKVIAQQKMNIITVIDPSTNKEIQFGVPSVSAKELTAITKNVFKENNIKRETDKPATLDFIDESTAILSFRTFSNSEFREYGMNFKKFVDSSFTVILTKDVHNLIIDMRDNGGGSEGNEDYLFSYLTNKPYNKYKYVEASALTFSFLDYTDYSDKKDKEELENELQTENQKSADGRYYRKPGIYIPEPARSNAFTGNLYILTSGWTYSGGAEFSSLMKEHTDAIFIGEEVGGGFYGNTSGTSLELTLPNTKLIIDIPILKFALDVTKGKRGHGVIPDHEIQPTFDEFIKGYDAELEYARKLIKNK